jgi:hypothetical protein
MSLLNLADSQPPAGLRQRQLCELMGWDYRQVAQIAKQQGMSTHAYVQQQTGWILRLELYYPPESKIL